MPAPDPARHESPFEQGYHVYGRVMAPELEVSDDWLLGYGEGWVRAMRRTLWHGRDGTPPVSIGLLDDGRRTIRVIAR